LTLTQYLKAIEKELVAGRATEHTHRPALKTLVESLDKKITVTNEPKRVECGAPDFIVTKGQTPLGYIEAKDVGTSLDNAEKTEQLERYRESLGNLILTDYLEFRWYVRPERTKANDFPIAEHRLSARLASVGKNGKLRLEKDGEKQVLELLNAFLNVSVPTVQSAKELAVRMAALAGLIRDTIRKAVSDEAETGTLHQQMQGFREVLIHDLTVDQFADMYAQTICYGLFAARCNQKGSDHFTREHAAYDLPKTNPFLRKMFNHIAGPELDDRIAWAVDDLAELLHHTRISDILVVGIGIFVRRSGARKRDATVRHAHFWGVREIYEDDAHGDSVLSGGKYHWLWNHDVSTTKWLELEPRSPFYLFMPQDLNLRAEYEVGWKLTDMMPISTVGIVTARDSLTIHWDQVSVWSTVTDFVKLPSEDARAKYELGDDAQDWKVELAQEDLRTSGLSQSKIAKLLYRPFDTRATYYTGQARGFICRPRAKVMRHMLGRKNLGLIATRQTRDAWAVLATQLIVGHKSLAAFDINSLFPLYLYSDASKKKLFETDRPTNVLNRKPNLSAEFIVDFAARLELIFAYDDDEGDPLKTFGPQDVFNYMYAVFRSPTYRRRYAEFLKIDFRRLPLTSNSELFRKLCSLGSELVALHLMEQYAPAITTYPIAGESKVEKLRYTAPGEGGSEVGRVWINREQYFEGVPTELWNFHVGGYQVLQKWLKDRKGRKLTYDDLTHYQHIVSALNETIRLMLEIDAAIEVNGGWPVK
jgi:hypothetical protein